MKNKLFVFSAIFLCCVFVFGIIAPAVITSEQISTKIFRLHILANSDSDEDQTLKLKVRDKILEYSEELYSDCRNVNDAITVSDNSISEFKEIAQKVIAFYGYDYDVNINVGKEYFPTREYENYTLPAGEYDCLKIIIGEGRGHNWWCVMFPQVCLSACSEDEFEYYLSEEEQDMIESDNYVIRFKAVEIYEKIKNKFNSQQQ